MDPWLFRTLLAKFTGLKIYWVDGDSDANVFLQTEMHTVLQQLEEVKEELALEKQKNRLMAAMAGGDGSRSERVEGQGQDQLATKEMQLLNERQKSELANVR